MKVLLLVPALSGCALFFAVGCSNLGEYETDSPTLRLLRGETHPDQFREDIAHTNERQRAQEAFEHNRTPTRAYNTKTRRFEFVPEDTVQAWNPDTQRWEFTPRDEEGERGRDKDKDLD